MEQTQITTAPPAAQPTGLPHTPFLARPLVRLGMIALLVAICHGASLTTDLWLDDYLHYQQLQAADWTFSDLVDAATLDAGVDRVRFWGTVENELHFFRPAAFGLMKAEYALVGWRPAGMHVFNLLWHVAVAYLVGSLVASLLREPRAAPIASILFAAMPNHVATVYWIACQTELMVTLFIVLTVLAYGRWAGWFGSIGSGRSRHLVLAIAAMAAAFGCRENAIILPGIIVVGDLLTAGRRAPRRCLWAWLLLAGVAGCYLLIRQLALADAALPHRPYLLYPWDPGFAAFAGRKVLYYLAGLFLYVPIVPGSAATYFATQTNLLWIGTGWSVIVLVAALLLWRVRLVLLAPAWILLAFLPILPVTPSPHHLYLPGVGAALLLTALLLGLWRAAHRALPVLDRAEPHLWRVAAGIGTTASVCACLIWGWIFILGISSEKQLVHDVLSQAHSVQPGDELFFINQPLIAGWPAPAIEVGSGGRLHGLKSYTLTLADTPLIMSHPSQVVPLDRYQLRLASDPPGWFSGTAGQVFADLSGTTWPFQPGQIIPGPVFDVTIEQTDPDSDGVTSLRLTFHEPIDKPKRHFYFGSPHRIAYPLGFTWQPAPAVTGP